MASLNIMPLMTDAILADCGYMQNAVFGAYMKLLIQWWRVEAKPMSRARLRLIAGCSEDEFDVIAEHLTETPDGFIQKKLCELWSQQLERSAKAKDKAGKRWSNNQNVRSADAAADAAALPQQCNPLTVNRSSIPDGMQDEQRAALVDHVSRETISPRRTPKQALCEVLDDERASALIEHRNRLRAPLTVRAAELLARQLALARDGPAAAADLMLERGWKGFKAEWDRGNDQATVDDARQAILRAVVG